MAAALAAVVVSPVVAATPAAAGPTGEDGWVPKTPRLSTPWTGEVGPRNAHPEYPRPQLTRQSWQNLNGVWQYAEAERDEEPPFGRDLPERILVPFPVESALSGIQRDDDRMWYRRSFTVPDGWRISPRARGNRLRLNFQGSDWKTDVWVNGQLVASHTGGYDSFSADVTRAVNRTGGNELVVGVYDPTDGGGQPIGKQRDTPGGIWYTSSSGIWQTVWMEPVAPAHITRLDLTPDVPASALKVTVRATGVTGERARVTVRQGTRVVGSVTGPANTPLAVPVPNPRLWSPDDPFLYDVRADLVAGDNARRVVDSVGSYAGMRSLGLAKGRDGLTRATLNGRFVFQIGTLDQGFWPDGIHTAPTDEALRFDLEQQKALGFNTVRKHIKVEPDRWYYHADRLGLLVWQDMPSMEAGHRPTTADKENFESEMRRMVDQHRSFVSIVQWVSLNEGWGQYDQARLADQLKAWDPSRLVNNMSGINCCGAVDGGNGDIKDWHNYPTPGPGLPEDDRAAVQGEFGGIGLHVEGHEWDHARSFAYEMAPDPAALTRRYTELLGVVHRCEMRCGLSAAIYTQPVDVELEINGLYTYDRRVLKMDADAVRAANRRLIDASPQADEPDGGPGPGTPGLTGVGYWALDEGAGTVAADGSGRGHHGTLVGGAAWTEGRTGAAVRLDGADDFVDTGDPVVDPRGSVSVAAWVNLAAPGDAFQTAVSQDGPSASTFFLQYSGADRRFAFSTVGGRALAGSVPEPNRWYHLAGVYDAGAGTMTLYVDGQRQGSFDLCLLDDPAGDLVIGRGRYGGNPVDFWQGSIDQVHAYDRALSAAEVGALYAGGS
jgi:hypothetical protein